MKYFSEREYGERPRTEEEIPHAVWGGIVALVEELVTRGAFGQSFPEECPDGQGIIGTNDRTLSLSIQAEIPGFSFPLNADEIPDNLALFDFLEFCHYHVAEPIEGGYHSFYRHTHLSFTSGGQERFRERINRIFRRNGLAYELREDGQVERLAPPVIQEALSGSIFKSGDSKLDE